MVIIFISKSKWGLATIRVAIIYCPVTGTTNEYTLIESNKRSILVNRRGVGDCTKWMQKKSKKEEKSELQFKIILSLADDKIKNLVKCVLEELIDYQL